MAYIDVPGLGRLTYSSDEEVGQIALRVQTAVLKGEPGLWLRSPTEARVMAWIPATVPIAFGYDTGVADLVVNGESVLTQPR